MPNLTSSMNILGQGAQDPLQAAIQARQSGGQPVPQLSQVTPGSGQVPPQGQPSAPQGTMTLPQGAAQKPTTEAELIVKGLSQRLSAISKVETAGVGGI